MSPLVAVDLRFRAGRTGGADPGDRQELIPGPQAVGTQFIVQFHFPAPIAVVPGAPYVIEWLSRALAGFPADRLITWMGRDDDPYAGDNMFGCTAVPVPANDLNFISYTD